MGDQLRPVHMPFNPLRINQRGEGHGRQQGEQGEQHEGDGQQQQQKRRPSNRINLNPSQEISDFAKLLRGEHKA